MPLVVADIPFAFILSALTFGTELELSLDDSLAIFIFFNKKQLFGE